MITYKQALAHKGEFWHMTWKNADGTPSRCRVNGQCQTWVRRPGEFKLPVKHGLHAHGYITHENAHEWCLPELWPVEHVLFEGVGLTPNARLKADALARARAAFKRSPTPALSSLIERLAA